MGKLSPQGTAITAADMVITLPFVENASKMSKMEEFENPAMNVDESTTIPQTERGWNRQSR